MKVIVFILAVATIVAAVLAGGSIGKPTRQECIVGFRLDWSGVTADRGDVRNRIFLPPDVPAALVFSDDGSRLYLQFRKDCENKRIMADNLIRRWEKSGLLLPRFSLIEEEILPSPATIDVSGPAWTD